MTIDIPKYADVSTKYFTAQVYVGGHIWKLNVKGFVNSIKIEDIVDIIKECEDAIKQLKLLHNKGR